MELNTGNLVEIVTFLILFLRGWGLPKSRIHGINVKITTKGT